MTALINHFKQYRFLLGELVAKGIKLRYRRSYLGVFWTMLEPLLNMIVLTIIFGPLLGYSEDPTFPVYVLSGRLIYTFFSQATKESTRSIRVNAAMIKKVYVPKYLYPFSTVIYNYIIFLISLIVLAAVSLILGIYPTPRTLLCVIPLLNVFILSMGVSMVLATVGVFFRDMEYLWNVALTLIMYMCAIFYTIDRLGDSPVVWVLKLNPLYCIIDNLRSCLGISGAYNWKFTFYALGFGVVALLIGSLMFKKQENKFILHI